MVDEQGGIEPVPRAPGPADRSHVRLYRCENDGCVHQGRQWTVWQILVQVGLLGWPTNLMCGGCGLEPRMVATTEPWVQGLPDVREALTSPAAAFAMGGTPPEETVHNGTDPRGHDLNADCWCRPRRLRYTEDGSTLEFNRDIGKWELVASGD